MRSFLRGSRSFLAIVVVLAAIPVAMLSWKGLGPYLSGHQTLRDVLSVSPYAMLAILGLLGARMGQLRILFVALLLAGSYWLLQLVSPLRGHSWAFRASALTIAVPASLIALSFLKPGRLRGKAGLWHLLACVLPAAALLAPQAAPALRPAVGRLPALALGLGAAYFAVTAALRDRYFREFHLAAGFALIPLGLLASQGAPRPYGAAAAFTGAGLVLLYAMYRVYWRKVYVDELTGVPNRRALDERLQQVGQSFAIAMADIDHFKKFNDRYGHEEGDNVLRFVAAQLDASSGSSVYRYGGEEFCFVFEGLERADVREVLEKARGELATRDFYVRDPASREEGSKQGRGAKADADKIKTRVTISIGVAYRSSESPTPEQVRSAADELLYLAKERGRNRVVSE